MENILQKIEKNWKLCLHDESTKKNTKKNRKSRPLRVIVCVSGGSDSIALIHLLHRLSSLLFLELYILHFNHQLRSESDQEQDFVRTLAEKFKIPFYFKKNNFFFKGQSGFQESARKWRLDESQNLLKSLNGDYIATAHHADDQIETLLLKILRGAHISKLHGMSWKKHPFVRPLLNCRKFELQDYLRKNNINWMEDSSNKSSTYLRNRVRFELIPLLQELTREGLQSRLFDLEDQSKILRDWLNLNYFEWSKFRDKKSGKGTDFICICELFRFEKIMQEEILFNFINEKTGQSLSYSNLQKIFDLISTNNELWEFHLSRDWKISLAEGKLRLKNRSTS